jgi:hypothetical protein
MMRRANVQLVTLVVNRENLDALASLLESGASRWSSARSIRSGGR